MTVYDIEQILTDLRRKHGTLRLTNYKRSTDNIIEPELIVHFVGDDIYRRLVRASFEEILNPNSKRLEKPLDVPRDAWKQALVEMKVSLAGSIIAPGSPSRVKYTISNSGILLNEKEPEIRGMENLVSDKPIIPRVQNHRNDLTQAKAVLRQQLQLGHYIGLMLFSPVKVDKIELIASECSIIQRLGLSD